MKFCSENLNTLPNLPIANPVHSGDERRILSKHQDPLGTVHDFEQYQNDWYEVGTALLKAVQQALKNRAYSLADSEQQASAFYALCIRNGGGLRPGSIAAGAIESVDLPASLLDVQSPNNFGIFIVTYRHFTTKEKLNFHVSGDVGAVARMAMIRLVDEEQKTTGTVRPFEISGFMPLSELS